MAIHAGYTPRAAHVEVIGELGDGSRDVGGGSGLLLSDRYVITNSHVVPDSGDYEQLTINVRLRSRLSTEPIAVTQVFRDGSRDLALLELAAPVANIGGRPCPIPVAHDRSVVPVGTRIYVLGYPLNQDLSIVDGLVSNHSGPSGRWQTNALLNAGNSGGPAFDGDGALVGFVVSGQSQFRLDDGTVLNVTGINFIIPTTDLILSPIYQKIAALPEGQRCWTPYPAPVAAAASTASGGLFGGILGGIFATRRERPPPPPPPPPLASAAALPPSFTRGHAVKLSKADHPDPLASHSRTYRSPLLAAESGYRIGGCDWTAESASRDRNIRCEVSPDGARAQLVVDLESGPSADPSRGWWVGTVYLKQVRQGD